MNIASLRAEGYADIALERSDDTLVWERVASGFNSLDDARRWVRRLGAPANRALYRIVAKRPDGATVRTPLAR